MENEGSTWQMHGLLKNDPNCILSADALTEYINEVGFLPLFENDIPGFSVEEHTASAYWWSETSFDPWSWRETIAAQGKVAYGKFFDKRAGFISLAWLPYFANYRRDGYDFDALWDDEKATFREKKLMDVFGTETELMSNELKMKAGFGKGGEKNFPGIVTDLQMKTYLCIRDFRQKINKKGEAYGWPLTVYTTPENIWGYELITSAYKEKPEKSKERIIGRIKELYPTATDTMMRKIL